MSSRDGQSETSLENPESPSSSVPERTVPDAGLDADQITRVEDTPKLIITKKNIEKMLSKYGVGFLTHEWTSGKTVLHKCAEGRHTSCVKLLLKYIVEKNIDATQIPLIQDGYIFILEHAIKNEALYNADAILTVLAEGFSKISTSFRREVIATLHHNFQQLLAHSPGRLRQFLMKDSFCFEQGKLEDVPRSVFTSKTEEQLDRMNAFYSGIEMNEDPREICPEALRERLNPETNEEKVTAVLKVFGVPVLGEDPTGNDGQIDNDNGVIHSLVASSLPVKVFNSEAIRKMVNHHWFKDWQSRVYFALGLHFVATICFTTFATTFGLDSDGSSDHDLLTARVSLAINCVLICLTWLMRAQPWARGISLLINLSLLGYCCSMDHHTPLTAVFTSVECLSTWTTVLWYLQFCSTEGPLVSMVRYVLRNVVTFVFLMTMILFGFGMAFVVLFSNAFAEDETRFDSLSRSYDTLYHALLGEFDSEVRNLDSISTPNSRLKVVRYESLTLVPIWRTTLFYVFLFVGTIVLLSLLISIISDTYDRVRLYEEAEVMKCRARIITGVRAPRFLVRFLKYIGNRMSWIPQPPAWLRQWCVRFMSWTLLAPDNVHQPLFYYLVPADPSLQKKAGDWKGKLRSVTKTVRRRLDSLERSSSAKSDQAFKRIEKLRETVEKLTTGPSNTLESCKGTAGSSSSKRVEPELT